MFFELKKKKKKDWNEKILRFRCLWCLDCYKCNVLNLKVHDWATLIDYFILRFYRFMIDIDGFAFILKT